jgi:hypothetical protein
MRTFILNIILPFSPSFRRFKKKFLKRHVPTREKQKEEQRELEQCKRELAWAEDRIERELLQLQIEMIESSSWVYDDFEKNPDDWNYSNAEIYQYMIDFKKAGKIID